MEKDKHIPEIRFAEFNEAWKSCKLGDYVQFSKGTGYSKGDLSESGTPIILYGRLYTNYETVITDVDTFTTAKPGSVYSRGGEVIVPASGETAEDISIASVVEKSGILLGGDLNIITPPESLDSAYLAISISNGKPHVAMAKMAQGKSVVHLHNTDLEKIDLVFPSHIEQKKISSYFTHLDALLTLHRRKLTKLQNVKKSMLEKMFPRPGANVPEIRFKGFEGPWTWKKLGEVFEEYSEKGRPELPVLTIIQGGGTIRRDESDRSMLYDKTALSNYKMVNANDFIVHLRSFEGGLEKATTLGIISPAYHTFHGKDIDPRFYYFYFRSTKFIKHDLKPHVYGIRDGRSIDVGGMKTIEIPWTCPEEQRTIGDCIENIDTLITLHQCKLEKLNNLKKSMLEKMFV